MEAKNPKMAKLISVAQIYLKIVVLAPPLCTLDGVTRPPIDPRGIFLVHMSAIPPKGTIPKPLKIGVLIQEDILSSPPNISWWAVKGGRGYKEFVYRCNLTLLVT